MNCLQAALDYARRGWAVFPLHTIRDGVCSCSDAECESAGKHPRTGAGFKEATKLELQIRRWWSRWPDANIGIATGAVSGLAVPDIDSEHGGKESLQGLLSQYGKQPVTITCRTGGGGIHCYFAHPGGELRNRTKLRPGIDFRGDGGYIVAPPSLHKSGNRYEWLPGHEPGTVESAPLPDWWTDLVLGKVHTNGHYSVGVDREALLRGVAKGERDVSIFKLACSLRADDVPYDRALRLVIETAARCNPPFPEPEAKRKLDQAWRYPPGKRLKVVFGKAPDYVVPLADDQVLPFPVEVLPPVLQKLIEEGTRSITCPPDFIAVPVLAALATAIGNSRVLRLKPGYTEGARFFMAIVGEPGSRKSPAIKLALKGIFKRQMQANNQWKKQKEDYRRNRAVWAIAIKEWEQRKANHAKHPEIVVGEQPIEPTEPRLMDYIGTDFTMEALGVMLDHNRRGMIAYHDELTAWVRSMDQYRNKKGGDRERWLSIWNGAVVKIDRKGSAGQPIFIPNPFICVVGGLQPDVLPELNDERGRDDGFVHRILFAFPDRANEHWTPDGVSEATEAVYCNLFDQIWATLRPEMIEDDERPKEVSFTPDGYAMWELWNRDHEAEVQSDYFPVNLRGPWLKFTSHCPRLALILQMTRWLCGDAESEHVDEDSVRGAAELVDYFKSHARRVYGQLSTRPEDKQAVAVAEWIKRHGGKATERDLLTHKVAGLKKASDIRRVLKDLEDRRLGIREKIGKSAGFALGAATVLDGANDD